MRRHIPQRIALSAIALATAALPFSSVSAALKTPADRFVRTANYYLKAGTDIASRDYPLLARYDMLIFPAEAQVYNRSMFSELRRLNPDILILAYVPTKSYNDSWVDPLHRTLRSGIEESWWMKDTAGNSVSVWPGTRVINAVTPWQSYLPQFVHDEIWATRLWDGVFYDEFSGNISWLNGGDIDLRRDGVRDDPVLADIGWKRSMENLLRNTRILLGDDAVIITNGDSTESLQEFTNGRMFETFPTPWEGQGRWEDSMGNYIRLHGMTGYSPALVINANTRNSGNNADFEEVRYTLGSTLLGDGFFSYDYGDRDHGQLWWYDEFDARLGRPLGAAVNTLSPNDATIRPGVWRRDFEHGIVLVNSTDTTQRVRFDQEFEKLRGAQSPTVNDGSIVNTVTLNGTDGIILRRPIDRIVGTAFTNGAFAQVYDMEGVRTRNGFFAYEAPFDGSASIIIKDIDGDGREETLVGDKGVISIYKDDGTLHRVFRPYGKAYTGPVNFAVGDLEGDGWLEIVTGAGPGGGPHVRVFNMEGRLINPGFFAYDPLFRGGVNVAVGDIYGMGRDVIVVGAGDGGGPHVRVFNKYGRLLHPGFFAYDWRFRGGVNVTTGDVNGDGLDEIVTGAGPGGAPHVRIFDGYGKSLSEGFFVGRKTATTGVAVATTDADGDGVMEITALVTDIFRFATSQETYD